MILAKFQRYLELIPERGLPWTEEALARLERAPAFVRTLARQAIEAEARRRSEKVVTPEVVDHVVRGFRSDPPLAPGGGEDITMPWAQAAEERLRRIPIPAVRRMVIQRVEAHARRQGLTVVGLDAYEVALRT
ncbi:MAG: PCP reductase family protein [Candidatus Rokubacteria bacterium]|nr:PCP reductase family protein [Candidatus Rokubacteria bacterium]